jgi:hypothetical protein
MPRRKPAGETFIVEPAPRPPLGKAHPLRVAKALALYDRLLRTLLLEARSERRTLKVRALEARLAVRLEGLSGVDLDAYYDGVAVLRRQLSPPPPDPE